MGMQHLGGKSNTAVILRDSSRHPLRESVAKLRTDSAQNSGCLRLLLWAGQNRLVRIEHDLVCPGGRRYMERRLFAIGKHPAKQQ
jgi:hypothetical protein